MALGPDPDVTCGPEFVEAMRPIGQDNVDRADVKPNLLALGKAVHAIATGPAEPYSGVTEDATFWQWVADLTAWATQMEQWRASVATAFAGWSPADAPGTALKGVLTAVQAPVMTPPAAPTEVKGKIR